MGVHDTRFDGKHVLITGGLGFIGANLAIRLIETGAKVTLIDSLVPEYGGNLFNIQPVDGLVTVNISDVRDAHSMQFLIQGQDFLFNLAGQTSHLDSMKDPYTDLEINSRAQLSILEACRHFNPRVHVVFASTRQVYGRPTRLPVNEEHPLMPVDVNGINKLAGEWYHLLYSKVYGIRTAVLRLTNTYGPRMRVVDARQTFLGIWIRRLLEGQPVLVYGDGMQVRDYNYVDDVVDALILATEEAAVGEVFNLGSREHMTLLETAQRMCSLADSGRFELVPFPEPLRSIDIGDYFGDYSKIKQRLGWEPRTSFAEGMEHTINYFRLHRAHYW